MIITPTDKGAGIAGIALSVIGWFSLFKLDHIAKLCHVDQWVKRDTIFAWITESTSNKALTLLFTEILNFTVHGITNPAGVIFACGSTIVNAFMIFVGLPLHMRAKRESQIVILKKEA